MIPTDPPINRSYLLGERSFRTVVRVLWFVVAGLLVVAGYAIVQTLEAIQVTPMTAATLVFGALLLVVVRTIAGWMPARSPRAKPPTG